MFFSGAYHNDIYTYCVQLFTYQNCYQPLRIDNSVARMKEFYQRKIWGWGTGGILIPTDKYSQKGNESLVTSNKDLAALVQGSVKCKKGKLHTIKETKKRILIAALS